MLIVILIVLKVKCRIPFKLIVSWQKVPICDMRKQVLTILVMLCNQFRNELADQFARNHL